MLDEPHCFVKICVSHRSPGSRSAGEAHDPAHSGRVPFTPGPAAALRLGRVVSEANVLYVSSSEVPSTSANSNAVMNMCAALAEHRAAVELIAVRGSADPATAGSVYGIPDELLPRLTTVPMLSSPMAGRVPVLTAAAAAVVRKRPSVVYSRDAAYLLGLPLGKFRTVYEVHHPPSPRLARVEDWLFRHRPPSLVVFISSALREHYRESAHGRRLRHSLILPSGARVISGELPMNEPPTVGYVGSAEDNRVELLKAIARALPEQAIHVYGPRSSPPEGWPANLTYHGVVPPSQVAVVTAGLDICLAPYDEGTLSSAGTPTARWMSPLKVIEYMGSGRTVLASDLPAVREVMTNGIDGVLCDPRDAADWVEAMTRVAGDRRLRRQLGSNARDAVLKRFSWSNRAAAVLAALRDLDPSV